jgi:positive regulator of sigma E activity
MKLNRLQKTLLVVMVVLFVVAYVFDGSDASLLFGLIGAVLGIYVVHTLPKRSSSSNLQK